MNTKLLLSGFALILFGCGNQPKQKDYEDESKTSTFTSVVAGTTPESSLVSIPIAVDYGAFGLMAVPADAYSVTLDDDPDGDPDGASTCLSAYTATVDITDVDGIEVYKDDRNCLAKLTSFTVGADTYTSTNTSAVDFTTWLANDTATFATAGGAKLIRVKVVSQLASPITGTEAIVYNFSELLDATGDYSFSEAEVSDAHAITVEGEEAPQFTVIAANYISADDVTGAPEFTFEMECVDDPTSATPTSIAMGAGTGADTLCSEQDLADIEYKLVLDTYTSVLTISDAETIFGTAGTTVAIPGDQYQTSASEEGFITAELDGPGPLGVSGNENMILILKAGISFTYYNIDVVTITQ